MTEFENEIKEAIEVIKKRQTESKTPLSLDTVIMEIKKQQD